MATSTETYRKHAVWETLRLKRESLSAARFDDQHSEKWRLEIVEWLDDAAKTRLTRQPALYLPSLDSLSTALNALPVSTAEFKEYVSEGYGRQRGLDVLQGALRELPSPGPKELRDSYVALLDKEVQFRTARLEELASRVAETEVALKHRLTELERIEKAVTALATKVETESAAIAAVSRAAREDIDAQWAEELAGWRNSRAATDASTDAEALAHVAALAATATAGEALAEHAAGTLSATDWNGRAKRERSAAHWIRAGAAAAFVAAGGVGFFIVNEAIREDFDLTLGDGVLRASIALVIGAFGALLLRESARHFREADTAEDVALSLKALAPFYAGAQENLRTAARLEVGDAVLVRNVLSRFAHRDAAKHAGDINAGDLPSLVRDAAIALRAQPDKAP